MSYPIHKVTGGSAARTVRTENGFWGLDLASGALDCPFSRAVDTENLIWQGDAVKVRSGYHCLFDLGSRINGIFFYGEQRIIHAGTALYRQTNDAEAPELIYSEMNDAPSQGVNRNQTLVLRTCKTPNLSAWSRTTETGDFLFLIDGKNYLVYDGKTVRSIADPYWGEDIKYLTRQGVYPVFCATVPFTAVAKVPASGNGDVDPRGDNRLTQFRCESFYVDDSAKVIDYVINCPAASFNNRIPVEWQIRDYDGVWRNLSYACGSNFLDHGLITKLRFPEICGGMSITLDADGRISVLGEGDTIVANDGMDNIRITYAVHKEPPTALTQSTAMGLYGADGADNVLFLGGGASAPGEDAFSARNDFFCFYETSVEKLGSNLTPVTGYCRLSDGRLAVLKDDPDGSTVFFRSHDTVTVGATQSGEAYTVDVFPSRSGASVEGCVSPLTVGVAGNEPCFLGKSGLYAVRSVSNELTNLNETVRRSVPVDPLLRTAEPAAARSICWQGYYLLTFGKVGVITDGRRDSSGNLRFLKWTFGHTVTALGQRDDTLYMGDENGNVYCFGEDPDDDGVFIKAFWRTPLLEDASGRRLILRRMWLAVSPGYGASMKVCFYSDGCPAKERQLNMHLLDYGDIDFNTFTFEGIDTARWVPLNLRSAVANAFSVELDLSEGAELLIWGFRMMYEKGGVMR